MTHVYVEGIAPGCNHVSKCGSLDPEPHVDQVERLRGLLRWRSNGGGGEAVTAKPTEEQKARAKEWLRGWLGDMREAEENLPALLAEERERALEEAASVFVLTHPHIASAILALKERT